MLKAKRIYFDDEGQDVLLWYLDPSGVVIGANAKEYACNGFIVWGLNDLRPGDYLHYTCPRLGSKVQTMCHPIARIDETIAASYIGSVHDTVDHINTNWQLMGLDKIMHNLLIELNTRNRSLVVAALQKARRQTRKITQQ